MIPAVEALTLPTAQLTPEEIAGANALEAEIDAHVKGHMERRGCDFTTTEIRNNVIAEVNQRLKRAGYNPQWQMLVERHKLNAALTQAVGAALMLAPNDEAYQAAGRSMLS